MTAVDVVREALSAHLMARGQWKEGEEARVTCACVGRPTFIGGEFEQHRAEAVVNALRAAGYIGPERAP